MAAAATDSDLLQAEGLSRSFTLRRGLSSTRFLAVDGASFSLPAARPEILALAGESGSGKTTLARIILGLIEPSAGRLLFQEREVTRLSGGERRNWFRRQVQPIFQDPYATFSPLRRVDSYLHETARNLGAASSQQSARERVEEVLAVVGLSQRDVRGRHPHELSGGQLQRVAIARALIPSPSLLVADEPVSMLDASLRMSILNLLKELKERQSVVYITHDLATVYYAADRVAIMLRGWIVELGPVERVLGSPLHPYTQVLKSSILEPVPGAARKEAIAMPVSESEGFLRSGCKFADRCPARMDICTQVVPEDRIVEGRLVKCHLHNEAGIAAVEAAASTA